MTSATLAGSVDAVISGDVSGQVAVGNNIVQYNVAHGGVVNVAAPEERPDPQPRPLPLPANLRGRRPRKLVGRDAELAAAANAIQDGIPLQFYGPPGIGKTSLLKTLAHLPADEAPDGALYHLAHGEDVDDTLQFLYETFYVSKVPFVATEAQLRLGLGGIQARIVLDDLGVSRDELESVLDVLPAATFVIASTRRTLWGDGKAVALRGLGTDAALELLERELGRSLEGEERAAGTAIVTALEGEALRILEVAAHVTERNEDLRTLADELSGARTDELHRKLVDSLSPDERAILEVMTALGGATLPAADLAEITGVADAGALVESLIRKGLLQAHSPRYSVTNGPAVAPLLDSDSWDRPLLAYFCGWAERNRGTPEKVLENAPAVLAVLGAAARNQASADLLRLGRAVEEPFALAGRWGAWHQVLGHELTAARRIGDRAGEGWALHQLGTKALCQGDPATARDRLTHALRIRESLGDVDGAAASRHNLRFLIGGGTPTKPAAYAAAAAAAPETHYWRPAAVLPAVGLGLPLLAIVGLVFTAALVLGGLAVVGLRTSSSGGGGSGDVSLLRITPPSLDFGEHAQGDPSPARTVTVTNAGDVAVPVERVVLTGAADAYRVESDNCRGTRLGSGSACTMAVLFNPPRSGRFDARLVARSDGRDGPSTKLTGVGTGGGSGGNGNGNGTGRAGAVALEPGAVDFGSQAVGDPPVVRDVTVVNGGPGDVQVQSVSVSGPPDFTLSRNACPTGTLAANARCTIQLAFRPTAEGGRLAQLTVASSGPGGPAVATLSGSGMSGPTCGLQLPGAQSVPYGGQLRLTARATGSPTPAFTAQGLPTALGLVDNRDGTATIAGTAQAVPGSYSPTVNATSGGRRCGSASVPITVTRAPVKLVWLQPLIDISLGAPATANVQLTQTAGTRGDYRNTLVFFDLTNTATREVFKVKPSAVDAAGRATMQIGPGEVPLGFYTARARLDPANQYFVMASPVPIAAVVNTDVLGASVYAISDLLSTVVPGL